MNVLFLTDGITPYVTGGMQQFASVLVKLLLNQNISITLVHCGEKGSSEFTNDILQHFEKKQLRRLKTVFIPFLNKGKWPGHYIYENKVYSQLIYQHFKAQVNDYDIVYAQGFTGWAFGRQTIKPKLLVNFHGFEMYQKAPSLKVKIEHLMLRPFVKSNCKRSDYVYSFGGKITEIIKSLGISEDRILNQSNGIEAKWLNKSNNTNQPLRYIFIGRNERRKGIEELTEALLQLKASHKLNFKFTFIGPIPPNSELVDKVDYVGEIKNQALIHEHLQKSDVLICPSHAEGMPTVILEAMANGLVIIGSDVGATSKMIDGNGILLENSSPDSISSAIKQITNTPKEKIEVMKLKAFELVKSQFIWEEIA
ncbi:MAG: glycosyltransferase family 4 protein, partial [Crocinitomicaceae bacterium]